MFIRKPYWSQSVWIIDFSRFSSIYFDIFRLNSVLYKWSKPIDIHRFLSIFIDSFFLSPPIKHHWTQKRSESIGIDRTRSTIINFIDLYRFSSILYLSIPHPLNFLKLKIGRNRSESIEFDRNSSTASIFIDFCLFTFRKLRTIINKHQRTSTNKNHQQISTQTSTSINKHQQSESATNINTKNINKQQQSTTTTNLVSSSSIKFPGLLPPP